jgi:hypothetical protein
MNHEEEQEHIVNECLNGDRRRSCADCPAHHSKNGPCCFGCRYEEDDEEHCMNCRHQYACSSATLSYENRMARQREANRKENRGLRVMNRSVPGRPSVGSPRPASRGGLIAETKSRSMSRSRDAEIVSAEDQPTSGKVSRFFKHMGLHALWGAGEGGLEMALRYMQRRRPD